MSIFVLGRSRTGKSPFAEKVSKYLGAGRIMASEWVRSRFPSEGYADRAAFVKAITAFSLGQLKENPLACVEFIRGKYDLSLFHVIEGIRNPSDFVQLFDPRKDVAVFLDHEGNDLPETDFEKGLAVIRVYLEYLAGTGMLPPDRIISYRFKEFYDPPGVFSGPIYDSQRDEEKVWQVASLEQAIDDFCLVAFDRLLLPPEAMRTYSPHAARRHVHCDIALIKCEVRAEYLYDMDPAHVGQRLPCTVFAISSYEGSVPTFKILLEDGTVFSYIPPSALAGQCVAADAQMQPAPELQLEELVYHNCPPGKFVVTCFDGLKGQVNAYFKKRKLWLAGNYILTMDWYEGNDLLHLVALSNGQYCLLPQHKLKFRDGCRDFAPFRKLHQTWQVPAPDAEKQETDTSRVSRH